MSHIESIRRRTKKILFCDSNIFIGCALEEVEGSTIQVLKDIKKQLDKNKAVLIVPKLIVAEVENRLRTQLKGLKGSLEAIIKKMKNEKGYKESGLVTSALLESDKIFKKKIETREKDIKKILESIYNHKNTIRPDISDGIIIKGIRRALFGRAPFTQKRGSFILHQDCIIFESLLETLSKITGVNQKELIFCAKDPDYSTNQQVESLSETVKEELKTTVKSTSFYTNSAKMLKEKFAESYSKKEVDKYDRDSVIFSPNTRSYEQDGITHVPSWLTTAGARTVLDSGIISNDFSTRVGSADRLRFSETYRTIPKCPNCGYEIIPSTTLGAGVTTEQKYFLCPMCGQEFFG